MNLQAARCTKLLRGPLRRRTCDERKPRSGTGPVRTSSHRRCAATAAPQRGDSRDGGDRDGEHRSHSQHRDRPRADQPRYRGRGSGDDLAGSAAHPRDRGRLQPAQPGRAKPRRELHLGWPHAEPVAGLPVRLGEPGGHHDLPGLRQPGVRVAGAHLRQRVPLAQRLRSCPEPDFHCPDHGGRTGGADRPDLPRPARCRRGRAAADTADHLRVPGADRLLRLRRGPRHPPGRAVMVQPLHRALGQAGRHRHHLVRLLLLGLGQRLHPHRGDP